MDSPWMMLLVGVALVIIAMILNALWQDRSEHKKRAKIFAESLVKFDEAELEFRRAGRQGKEAREKRWNALRQIADNLPISVRTLVISTKERWTNKNFIQIIEEPGDSWDLPTVREYVKKWGPKTQK